MFAELHFRDIGLRQADVVDLALHGFEMLDAVLEDARDIADVDVIALEVTLEQDDEAVVHGAVSEIVDQQVDAHAR